MTTTGMTAWCGCRAATAATFGTRRRAGDEASDENDNMGCDDVEEDDDEDRDDGMARVQGKAIIHHCIMECSISKKCPQKFRVKSF